MRGNTLERSPKARLQAIEQWVKFRRASVYSREKEGQRPQPVSQEHPLY